MSTALPLSQALPSQTRSVASLATLYIARMLGLFMVLPVLSLAGDEYIGSNVFLLGVALGVYGLTQACLQIPFGILSDRFGRKPLIVIGLVLFGLGSILAASAQTVEGLIAGRALQGAGAIAGVIMAMVGDLTTGKDRSKAMASIGASIGVAFALSLVLGPVVTSVGGIRWVFWLTLGLSIAGILIVLFAIPAVPQVSVKRSLSLRGIKIVASDINLWRLNVGIFVLHAVLMALFVALPLLLTSVDIPQSKHAWVYLSVMGIAFLLMVPLMIIGERQGKVRCIFLSILILAVFALLGLSLVVAGTDTDVLLVLLSTLVFFIAFNYLEATLPSLMSKTVTASQRGAGSGLFSTCQFLGAAVGGMMGGWLFSQFGLSVMLLACSGLLLCWWLFALAMVIPQSAEIKTENVVV
ncbi:MAG: MFS family permease [Cellvibrionaceae bacterium]|jgi:MFS family permease